MPNIGFARRSKICLVFRLTHNPPLPPTHKFHSIRSALRDFPHLHSGHHNNNLLNSFLPQKSKSFVSCLLLWEKMLSFWYAWSGEAVSEIATWSDSPFPLISTAWI